MLPEVVWLDVGGIETPSAGVMAGWVEEGARKASIDDETDHVDAEVLRGMLAAKSALDLLNDSRAFSDARARANPFEGIKKEFFLNRAALKMAAIDTALEGIFSCADAPDPPSAYDEAVSWHYRAASEAARGQHAAPGQPPPPPPPPKPAPGLLYFGDVAAGPGGFAEYVLWRRGGSAKGFGFTLRGDHDFTPGRSPLSPYLPLSPRRRPRLYARPLPRLRAGRAFPPLLRPGQRRRPVLVAQPARAARARDALDGRARAAHDDGRRRLRRVG